MRELTHLRDEVAVWEKVSHRLSDAAELAELQDEELYNDLRRELETLEYAVGKLEFRALFAGKYDDEPAFLAIHAGAGGTEAQDWALMLQRMFIRWAEASGLKIEILDESPGDEAGIKSTLMSVVGDYA
jgi:peptide chain release factor 2